MLVRERIENREEWLIQRNQQGIGGSEAATAVGMSPWQSPLELWKLKTGETKPKDLSNSEAVQKGNRLEPILRELFKATHPTMAVEYNQFDILYQDESPWLFATLDGEITDEKGKQGVLEIKTSTPRNKAGWDKWNNTVPNNYTLQCMHQLLATGYDFVIIYAALFDSDGNIQIREYRLDRIDFTEDMEWLFAEERKFWEMCVYRKRPPVQLSL